MSGLSNKAVVDNRQELRPVRFTETGRMRLGKILKAARQISSSAELITQINIMI